MAKLLLQNDMAFAYKSGQLFSFIFTVNGVDEDGIDVMRMHERLVQSWLKFFYNKNTGKIAWTGKILAPSYEIAVQKYEQLLKDNPVPTMIELMNDNVEKQEYHDWSRDGEEKW